MQVQLHDGAAFYDYTQLLPFLADVPGGNNRLTAANRPSWYDPAWDVTYTHDFTAFLFEGRGELPPAILLHPIDPTQRGRVVLQYKHQEGTPFYTVIVTKGGRTVWQEEHVATHDVTETLHKALDMLRETPAAYVAPPVAPPAQPAPPPIDPRHPIPLVHAPVPAWWDVHWHGYDFTDLYMAGLPTNRLRPPTIILESRIDNEFEIVVHDYTQDPWRKVWPAPERPIQILVTFQGKPIYEQRLPADKLRIYRGWQSAARMLRREIATKQQREKQQVDIGLPPPGPTTMRQVDPFYDVLHPRRTNIAPTQPVAPHEVDLPEAAPPQLQTFTRKTLFPQFADIHDPTDPADEGLATTGLVATFIAPVGANPPVLILRRTERSLDPTIAEPSKEDRILVTWFGARWSRKRFKQLPYNIRVYFANRLLAEDNVAAPGEAWRLVQKANRDLAAKRRRVEIADITIKPIKLVVNARQIELTPEMIARIKGVIANGDTYRFLYRNKELYGVRKGKKPKVISVPYGDTKPVYIKALDAWVGLIKAEG
jgi:hypothetical protein